MADVAESSPEKNERPQPAPLTLNDGLGCLTVIVVLVVAAAVASMFWSTPGDGWKVAAAVALSAMGVGVVWVCARYRA